MQTSFPVHSGEILDITMAFEDHLIVLEDRVVTFVGKVIYIGGLQGQDTQLGICIEGIKGQDRTKLDQFIHGILLSRLEQHMMIARMGRIICPNCGKEIGSVGRLKDMTASVGNFSISGVVDRGMR